MKHIWGLLGIFVIVLLIYGLFLTKIDQIQPVRLVLKTPSEARKAIADCFDSGGRYIAIETEYYGSDGGHRKPSQWTVECHRNN